MMLFFSQQRALLFLSSTLAAAVLPLTVSAYGPTTLEQALTRAYNLKVSDGTWASLFGRESLTDFRADNFCTGSVDGWAVPLPTGDLARVLTNGVFQCGHIMKTNFATPEGEVLLRAGDTPDGEVIGAGNDLWVAMIEELSNMYDQEIVLNWKLYPTSQEVLDALQSGELDGACAYWQSDGTWTDPDGDQIARGLAFSKHVCPTTVQTEFVWTLADSGIDNWQELVQQINQGNITRVCARAAPNSGTETNCRNTLKQAIELDCKV
jgi:hypothetical protein